MNAQLLLTEACPCSDRVREEFNAWIRALFETSPNEQEVIDTFHEPMPKKASGKSVKKIDGSLKKETLSELLEHIDSTFKLIKLPTGRESWIDKDEAIGLRKIGIHVPNPWVLDWVANEDEISVDRSRPLPSIIAIALLPSQSINNVLDDGKISPGISFAIRLRKPPYFIKHKDGCVYYKYGHSYMIDEKNFYICMYASIDADGHITICDELTSRETVIPSKHRKSGAPRFVTFSQKRWGTASMLYDESDSIDRRRLIEKNVLANIIRWWSARDDRWNVVVKKGGERVTFSIDQSLSKDYFADRNVCINSSTGKPMKIVHYVSGHDRNINGKVSHIKEHIRGVREFDWKGYHCLVTAPQFTGKTAASVDLEAEDFSDEEPLTKKYIRTSKFGSLMADFEERDMRKNKKRKPGAGTP